MALADTAKLAVQIDLQGNASAGIDRLNRKVAGLGTSIGRTGKGFAQVGRGLGRAGLIIGGAAVTGLAAAAKAAIDFEDAFSGVKKTVDEADLKRAGLSFESLAKSIRTMATEIPIAATDLSAIAEAAGALGIRATDIEAFTKTVALLGVTTNLTTDEAASALGKLGVVLGLRGADFQKFGDVLVNLGNKGASTETEIVEVAKRFGAAGRQAGLSTPQILAFASAIASAGVEPEAAGSSLSRLFGNMIAETAKGTKAAKTFAKVSGKSFKAWSTLVKKDTAGAMLAFLKNLRKLDKFGQIKALEDVGITNVRDRNAVLLLAKSYDENLIPALKNAQTSAGALSTEAKKKFDTVKNSILLLKNNLIEAGITLGEGFAPAIGRAAKKLSDFLKIDANKSQLKSIGEDIGKAIDDINWDDVLRNAKEFVTVMRGALGVAKGIFDAINALPTQVKAAAAALLLLNKASGGLIGAGAGNILGGLGETVARSAGSKLPGIGKLFAQPVFVTNWPLGGFGGTPIPGKGGPGIGGIIKATIVGAVIVEGLATWMQSIQGFVEANKPLVNAGLTEGEIQAQHYYTASIAEQQTIAKRLGGIPSKQDWLSGLAKLNQPHNLPPGHTPGGRPGAPPRPRGSGLPPGHDPVPPAIGKTTDAVNALRESAIPKVGETTTAVQMVKDAVAAAGQTTTGKLTTTSAAIQATTRSATLTAANIGANATRTSTAALIAAMYATRPIINVNNVTRYTTTQNRYGPGQPSAYQNRPNPDAG